MDRVKSFLADNRQIAAVAVLILVVHGIYTFHYGPVLAPDTRKYSMWADSLISCNYNIVAYLTNTNFPVPPVMYSAFVTLVAVTKSLFGASWPVGIITFNLFSHLSTAVLCMAILKYVTKDPLASVVGGLLFFLTFEILLWVPYALTEAGFMFLSFAAFCLLYLAVEGTDGRRKRIMWVAAFAALAVSSTYRPATMPLAGLMVFMLLAQRFIDPADNEKRAKWAVRTFVFFAVLFSAGILLNAYFMQDFSRWPFEKFSYFLKAISKRYHTGTIIDDRPQTYLAEPQTLLDYAGITFYRIPYFFVFYLKVFSLKHKVANIISFVPIYGLALVSFIELFRPKGRLSPQAWTMVFLASLATLFFAVFNSVLLIDYDWRYRLPCMPLLILMAGIGAVVIKDYLGKKPSENPSGTAG